MLKKRPANKPREGLESTVVPTRETGRFSLLWEGFLKLSLGIRIGFLDAELISYIEKMKNY